MSSENSVSYEEEVVVETTVTREVDVEVTGGDPAQVEVTRTVEAEPVKTVEVTRTVEAGPVTTVEVKRDKPALPEGVSFDSEHSYEVSVEKVVEVDRVIETEVVRNGEVIERRGDDEKVLLNYRRNRLTTFVKMMEFLKRSESSRFALQAEMMKRSVRFRQFGEFLRLYLSDENRLREFAEGKLEKEDVKMAQRMVVDEDILEKMRQFYMVNSWQEKRVQQYSDLIEFARRQGEKSPEEEARLVDVMENGLNSHNTVQLGMYGLRTVDETEGLWGVGYVPFQETPDVLDEDRDHAPMIELPPLPADLEGQPEGEEEWRKAGFFVRNRSRRLAFNDSLVVDRGSSEILGSDGAAEDFASGKKVDFEYEIFGHLKVDLEHTLLWKKLKLNADRACDERKIAVRKFLGKKRATRLKDEQLQKEAREFVEQKGELEKEAKKVRAEYSASAGDLSRREEQISEFFKLVVQANSKDLTESVFLSEANPDEYVIRERERERSFARKTTTTKVTRVLSIIDGEVRETTEVRGEEIESENADYDAEVSPFVQEVFRVGDTYVSLYLMELLEESPAARQRALKEIIHRGDFVFLKEEYRNLGMTVETEVMDERLIENDKWLYMVYFQGGYKRLFSLMDARFSHYRTDLVKIYEPGHSGNRYKSNFFALTSKITERTNESLSSEPSVYRKQLVRWNYDELEARGSDFVDWTRRPRLLHDIRQLSTREFMWSLGFLRSDSTIDGRIMPYWPFSPVRRDELNLYLERRPQLKMIMMKPGKEVIARERELSISSTSSHERERVYVKDVEKNVDIQIIEKNKKPLSKPPSQLSQSSEAVIARPGGGSSGSITTAPSSNASSKGGGRMGKGVLLAMILMGSIAVGSIVGATIAVVNLLPPAEVPIQTNSSPATVVDVSKRVKPANTTPTPTNIPKKVQPVKSSAIQPLKQKTTIQNPDLKFTKTKAKPMANTSPPAQSHPPKQIKVVPVAPKKTPPKPSVPNQKVMVDSQHQSHTFVVEHHYIQPQFVIAPQQVNQHPPIININNETSAESAASAPAPAPAPVVAQAQTNTAPAPQVIHQAAQPSPVIVSHQPSGPVHVQPKIEFNPVITPTINVPINIQSPSAPAPGKTVNKTVNNHKIINTSTPAQPTVVNNLEKIVETHGQVQEMKEAHKNQQNMIVSDENELSDIDALVNDIKMNVSTDQEMSDLKNLIIHRDQVTQDRKAAQEEPMKIIIKNPHSHRHHHHHHSAGPSFVGILTTTIKRHPQRHGGESSHHRVGSSYMGASHAHHRHHKSHHGFISQFRIKSATPPVPPVRIRKTTEGRIKSSDEALSASADNYKDANVAVKQPAAALRPVATVSTMPAANCSGHAVVPVALKPGCHGKKHKKRQRKNKRKLKGVRSRHRNSATSEDEFRDFTELPMFDNEDAVLDTPGAGELQKSQRQWNHRFNMFRYFDKNKPLKKAGTADARGMVSFDFPKMAMDMGLEMGLNDKDIREVADYVDHSQSLKV